jgi:FixJ family two-component response regulator
MIFLVEDDDATRDAISMLLECESLPVKGFSSCDALCAAVDPLEADCLVLDVQVRGTTGLEFLERLRTQGTTLPVILMTGRIFADLRDRATAASAAVLLEKPFKGNDLVEAVTHALAAHKTSAAVH